MSNKILLIHINDIVELKLNNVKSGDFVINGLNTNYMFKY